MSIGEPAHPIHIVGVGASAGGLSALEIFFSRLPVNTGMAFVVIQHLSPHFKSLMDDLLARHTAMPIHMATHGMVVEPNRVYLIPPNCQMTLDGRRLQVSERGAGPAADLPIDVFLHSLAQSAKSAAIAIILSGTGTDGSRGIKAVRREGGLVLVQTPETAQFDGMPRSALATGICDYHSDPGGLAELIAQLARDPSIAREELFEARPETCSRGECSGIFRQLQSAFEIDFSRYKMPTVVRRIRRRMEFVQITSVEDYTIFLAANPDELQALYRDLLIGVTEFFRDPECFEFLARQVVPDLMAEVRNGDDLRIWSAACATGEEAYSLAIIALETAESLGFRRRVSVFATDVHRASLESAAAGYYEAQRLTNVSPERLARFFRKEADGRYKINSELRKAVIFAPHNLTKDPPFTKLDLISCRNLLIYLQPDMQDHVISMFHFALRQGGLLLLGSSEAPGQRGCVFEPVEPHLKIYKKSGTTHPLSARPVDFVPKPGLPASLPAGRSVNIDRQLLHDYDCILARQAPGLIIDENRNVLHYFGDIAAYLAKPKGRPPKEVYDQVDGDLQVALSTALPRTEKSAEKIVLRNIRVQRDAEEVFVDLNVDPLWDPRTRTTHYHIFLSEIRKAIPLAVSSEQSLEFETISHQEKWISDLKNELRSTKANLQTAIEELQASNQELQAANEELLASNEELQSTNEELHSVNEELYTVNTEFERKNLELMQINLDHDHLLSSIQVGIIFLDKHLRIRKFNEFVSSSFKLLPQDVGRPIDHIAYHLEQGRRIVDDVQEVLRTGVAQEQEVETPEGATLLKRILPFRNEQGLTAGAVLTFTDVTGLKHAERALSRLNADLERLVAIRTRELERSNKDLQAYAYTVSHDLREPLRMIHTHVQLLERRCPPPSGSPCNDYMQVIKSGTMRMNEMLGGLLQYSRAGQDSAALVLVRCDEIVRSVIESLSVLIASTNARIHVGNLPEVWAWQGRLDQVFQNLIGNAIKYRRPEVTPEIEIWAERQHDSWIFAVRDNGIGFDMAHAERIFGVFKRLHTIQEYEGEGMGLAIVRRIVERHDGRVWAESKPMQGSTFYFSLPSSPQRLPENTELDG